jgi:hypothetical protein
MSNSHWRLIIALLLLATLAAALPADSSGSDISYDEEDILEDIRLLMPELWRYGFPNLEPILHALSAQIYSSRTVSAQNSDDNIQRQNAPAEAQFNTPTSSVIAYGGSQSDTLGRPPSQTISTASSSTLATTATFQTPNNAQSNIETRLETAYTITNPNQISPPQRASSPPRSFHTADFIMDDWLNNTYTTGERVQPSSLPPNALGWHQRYPQNQLIHIEPASTLNAQRPSTPLTPPTSPDRISDSSSFPCNHTGCDHIALTRSNLAHHQRYHIPMELRPYPCGYMSCHYRFLTPREQTRHRATHGLGTRRHYCPRLGCEYATRGFNRNDNLLRHLRSRHRA